MLLIKTLGKPRDYEYMYLIDLSFGGPLISNQVELEYNAKTNEWNIIIFDDDE